MASPSSVLNICNLALSSLGEDYLSPTADITAPTNTREKLCGLYFDQSIKSVVSSHGWRALTTHSTLTEDESNPPTLPEYTKRFSFPTDKRVCKLLSIYLDGYEYKNEDTLHPYTIEGESILCNATEVIISYTYYPIQGNLSANNWATLLNAYFAKTDDSLYQLFPLKLAIALSMPLTQNATLAQSLLQQYAIQEQRAIARNKGQQQRIKFVNTSIIDARYRYHA